MSSTSPDCYLSCSLGVCYYGSSTSSNWNSSTPNSLTKTTLPSSVVGGSTGYCCRYSQGQYSADQFCCFDSTIAVQVSPSDNAPSYCYTSTWTSWRMMALTLGIISMALLLAAFLHSAKRFHRRRRLRGHSHTTDAERRSSSSTIIEPPGRLWTVASGTSSSRHVAAGTTLSGTTSEETVLPPDFIFQPPSYDSLVPAADDYDKAPPPSYHELVIDVSGCCVGPSALGNLPSGSTAETETSACDRESVDGRRQYLDQLPTPQSYRDIRQLELEIRGVANDALDVASEGEENPRTVGRTIGDERTGNRT